MGLEVKDIALCCKTWEAGDEDDTYLWVRAGDGAGNRSVKDGGVLNGIRCVAILRLLEEPSHQKSWQSHHLSMRPLKATPE